MSAHANLVAILCALVVLLVAPLLLRWWAARNASRAAWIPLIRCATCGETAPYKCGADFADGEGHRSHCSFECADRDEQRRRANVPQNARRCLRCAGTGRFEVSGVWTGGAAARPWWCSTCKGIGWLP